MKLLSFNMCLDRPRLQERLIELGKLVQSLKPEFVAIQDINIEIAKKIKKLPWGERYHLVQPNITYDMRTKPCNVIFSTYPPQETKSRPFEDTEENKTLFYAYFVLNDKKRQPKVFSVANVRLEVKEDATELRESQLVQTLYMLREDDDALAVGDLNLHPVDGKINLFGGWEDVWLSSGKSSESGNTFDPEKNGFVSGGDKSARRPDRILSRLSNYQVDSIELVGTDPVGEGGLFISERFGLLLTFSARDAPISPTPAVELPCSFKRS
jgi:hypothetical protein